jgi:NAD(P)-dependent dehydrogenase (short-subunit alcohol dehydrogenase family)
MPDFPAGRALVVGGSGGIGRAICRRLAAAGTDVALTYRGNAGAAEDAAGDVRAAGRAASVHRLALEDAAAVRALVEGLGAVHTVVHAAGAPIGQPYISQVTPEAWRAVIDAEVNGFFHLVHAAIPALRATRGSLVAVTSAGLLRYPARDALSVAPKAALTALCVGLAREEGRYGVRANCVALGVIEAGIFLRLREDTFTPAWLDAMRANTALGRFGAAEEAAEAVCFLASARASFITGQTLAVDGGYSL